LAAVRWSLSFSIVILLLASISYGASSADPKTKFTYNIPAQLLVDALLKVAHQSDLTLVVSQKDIQGEISLAVIGRMTPGQALEQMLTSSALGFKFINKSTVSIAPEHRKPAASAVASRDTVNTGQSVNPPEQYIPRIEEIIVTSQRRSENLQNVPMAVSVLDNILLEDLGIDDIGDVALKVPGLTVSLFSLGQPTIHIRGIGSNDDGAGLDSSVVLFIDDIYVGRITAMDFDLLDLEQVEVLRGPQGSLYGKNSIGGAIKLQSKLPSEEASGKISVTTGNYNRFNLAAKLNGPLSDNGIYGSLSIASSTRDGWQKNIIADSGRQHDEENQTLRAKLLTEINTHTKLLITADYTRDNRGSTGRIPVVGRRPIRVLDASGQPIPVVDESGSPILDASGRPLFEAQLPTDIFSSLNGDPSHATNDIIGFTDRSILGIASRLDRDTKVGTLSSITGFRTSEFKWLEDSVGLPNFITDELVDNQVDEDHEQFSQEIRWVSNEDSAFSYIAGLYYLRENTGRDERFFFPPGNARIFQKNTTDSASVFAQANYAISERIKFGLGGRLSYDRKQIDQSIRGGNAPAIILEDFDIKNSASWTDFSPSFSASYFVNKDVHIFTRIARGFKSGGFQGSPATLESARRTVKPEFAWQYELGLKSQLFNDQLRLNLSAFYLDYSDLQVVQFRTVNNFGVFETSNAGSAKVHGLEYEFEASVTQHISVAGSYAYLKATYDEFTDRENRDFSGNRLRQAPEHSANLLLSYQRRVFSGDVRFLLDYRYQDKSFREPDNNVTELPAFDLLDASIIFTTSDEQWQAKLWSKNLLDEQYVSHLYILGGNDYALFGTPRTYGVTLSRHFL